MAKQTNFIQSLMHFSKNLIGAGIFSIGTGFKDAGLATAIVILVCETLMIAHCVRLLVGSLEKAVEINNAKLDALEEEEPAQDEEMAKQAREVSFPGMARIVFENGDWSFRLKLAKIVDITMRILICIQYTGGSSLYIIFVGKMIKQIVDSFDYDIDVHLTMALAAIPMGSLGLIPDLKWIAIIAGCGNLFFMVTYIIVNYYLIRRLKEQGRPKIVMVGKPTTIPILFGVILFSYETVATVFSLRHVMKDPSQLRSRFGVINLGFGFGFILILGMGVLGYVSYGDTLGETVLIDLPPKELPARIAFVTVSIHMMSTYPVNLYVPFKIIWADILKHYGPFKHSWIWSNLVRLSLIFCTLIIAESVPYIDLMLSLVGCVCATWLTLFLGPLLNIIINKNVLEGCKKKLNKSKNILLMVLGILIFLIGCSIVLLQIVKAIRKDFGYDVD